MNRFSQRGNRLSGYPFINSPVKLPGSAAAITRGAIVTGTGTSLSVPADLRTGDILFVASVNTNATCALPTGFTAGQSANTNGVGYRWSYKRVTSTVDTTVAGLTSAANHWITFFRGVDIGTALDVTSPTRATAASGQPDSPSITPVTSGALVISLTYRIVSDSVGYTPPTGFSDTQYYAPTGRTINYASKVVTPAAATNPSAWNVSITTSGWIAVSIALRPQYATDGASVWPITRPIKEWYQSSTLLFYNFVKPESLNIYGADVYDLTTKKLTGTVTGGYTKSNYTLTLNGTSGQLVAPVSDTMLRTGFAIMGWMTFTNATGSILSITGLAASGSPFVYMRWVSGSGLSVYVKGGYNLTYATAPTGKPTQFVIMHDGTTWTLFIDGVRVSEYIGAEGSATGYQLMIGNGYSGYYPAILHRLEIYDFWMTDATVLNSYLSRYRSFNPRLPGPQYTDDASLHFNIADAMSYPGSGSYIDSLYGVSSIVMSSSASYKQDGSLIGYAHMDGISQSMSLNDAKSELGSTFTISMSFASNVAAGRAFFTIATEIGSSTPWLMLYRDSISTLSLYVNGGFNLNATISITTWYALHITYDGTTWKLYINGALKSSYVGALGATSGTSTYFGNGSTYGYCNVAFQQYKTRNGVVLNTIEIAREAQAFLAAVPSATGV